MIKIITDSTSYIPHELQEKYSITVLSHCITVDGQDYYETDISNYSFYKKIQEASEWPVSNPPTYDMILEAFEKEVAAGNTVIGIFISNLTSETVQRANKAKEAALKKYPKANITVIDSKNTCMALGITALTAAETSEKGAWLEDVVEAANSTILRNRILFMPKKLDYMFKSGKISKTKAWIGDFMQLIPLITMQKGEITPLETVRTRDKAIDRMVEIMKNDVDKFGVNKVVVTHIDDIEEAKNLSEKIVGFIDVPVEISEIGPAVGVTVGPGTLGLIYNTIDTIPVNI